MRNVFNSYRNVTTQLGVLSSAREASRLRCARGTAVTRQSSVHKRGPRESRCDGTTEHSRHRRENQPNKATRRSHKQRRTQARPLLRDHISRTLGRTLRYVISRKPSSRRLIQRRTHCAATLHASRSVCPLAGSGTSERCTVQRVTLNGTRPSIYGCTHTPAKPMHDRKDTRCRPHHTTRLASTHASSHALFASCVLNDSPRRTNSVLGRKIVLVTQSAHGRRIVRKLMPCSPRCIFILVHAALVSWKVERCHNELAGTPRVITRRLTPARPPSPWPLARLTT